MQQAEADALYDQGTELTLLTQLLDRLDNTIVLDVGAEKGKFVRALLRAGAEGVYAIEPFPSNVEALQAEFGDLPTVRILAMALGAHDDAVQLHIVEDKTGRLPDAYHSLVAFEETPTLRMVGEVPVQCRSLDSLVAEGAIPAVAGILKIDTERADFDVLRGMGRFFSPVVMIEYWDDLPETVGPSAYRVAEVADFMADRGYSNYVVIKRHDEFELLQLNRSETRPGDWGNIVFVHDTVFPRLSPIILEALARAQEELLDKAAFFAKEAADRIQVIDRVRQVADDRLALIEQLRQAAEERGSALEEMRQAAEERLGAIRQLERSIAASRAGMIEEQELALEAYLRVARDDGFWKWVAPQLGVLHQHAPMPFQVPEHYLRVSPLASAPIISIVTPTLNAAQFLPTTLDSVLDQDYPALEYIVQDGESTDRTPHVLEQYRPRLARVASEKDSGMAQAINRGFAHSTGDIMAYLNADDLLLPGSLNFVAAYFEAHPDIDVVYGHRVLIDADGAEIGRWVLPPHEDEVLSWADFVPQETLFWRRDIWERAGGAMDESFRFALDWDLLLRFRDAGARFVRLPRFLGAFRVHADQKTSAQLADVGTSEMNRIRERLVGRPVSHAEAWRYVEPYMQRHKLYHKLYRLGALAY